MKSKKKMLVIAYAIGVAVWILFGVGQLIRSGYYQAKGLAEQQTLTWQQLTPVSIKQLDNDSGEIWYVSTDSDPQLHWTGDVYLNQVELDITHTTPGLSVVLYWKEPGQTDFSEKQSVYAVQTGEGSYRFDLGGKHVSEIRIDPDSVGGVTTRFDGVVLNPQTPWYHAFAPTGTGILLFLVLPLVGAAVVLEGNEIRKEIRFAKEK